jgi:hypothetical protein
METYANANLRRRVWLRRLFGLALVMAICIVAVVVDA